MAKPTVLIEDFADMLGFDTPAPQTQSEPTALPVQGGIEEMAFAIMESLPDHRFKLYTGKRFDDMTESIRQVGILFPIIIWKTDDGRYIILSGHNRKHCGMVAGLTKAPVIIKSHLTYEEAMFIVIETNLRQRSFTDMSESERAYCLYEHYKIVKSQGKRNDLIAEIERLMNPVNSSVSDSSAEISRSSSSRSEMADEYSLTEDKLAKYIRIGEHLDTALMDLFDKKSFPIYIANTLSFVESSDKQQRIADFMEADGYKVDMKKAELLREYYDKSALSDKTIVQILSGEKTRKPKSDRPKPVKIKPAVITKYFTAGESPKEIEDTIDKALALYFENQENEQEAIN